MEIRSRYIIPAAIAIAALTGYLAREQFFFELPYPPVDKQRAILVHKSLVKTPSRILDSIAIIHDLEYLASDACEGRRPGSAGHNRAVERVMTRMREAGLDSFNNTLRQVFTGKYKNPSAKGENIIGWLKGTQYPDRYIVISAHYDHLGKQGGQIYYGASDNASGTACILALANYFRQNPHPYSLIFAAFDREETGLEGAHSFVNQLPPPITISNIKFNLNIDMIARNDNNEIFACGINHYPSFAYAVREVQYKTNAKLLMGHDKGSRHEDWTRQSDHFAFHEKQIPFLYIGVEDHPDYHAPTDTYDKINYSMYIENCNMVALLASALRGL